LFTLVVIMYIIFSMVIAFKDTDSAIVKGIKTVGIGKKGSRPLEAELISEIISDLEGGGVNEAAKGAFFGALIIKGVNSQEKKLLNYFCLDKLAGNVDAPIRKFCEKLANKEFLNVQESQELGRFLLSEFPGDFVRGFVASILRVRYETADEYEGLLNSLNATIEKLFQEKPPEGAPIIQIAEPFDGCDHSNLITPLVADYLQKQNYRVVSLIGRNSGPKYGNNLFDLTRLLNAKMLTDVNQLTGAPMYGWNLDQKVMSSAMDRWVDIRHQIIKRPFMATLERFVNPVHADILIASAFHPGYGEKMMTIAQRAGFRGAIIIRNGLEGSLAFPLIRSAKVLCGFRRTDSSYQTEEFDFSAETILDAKVTLEEKLDNPSLEKNAQLIQQFRKDGKTDYELFDSRVKVTCAGLTKALECLQL